jgi:hypothetical protein
MEKTGSKSLPALARLSFAAAGNEQGVSRLRSDVMVHQ